MTPHGICMMTSVYIIYNSNQSVNGNTNLIQFTIRIISFLILNYFFSLIIPSTQPYSLIPIITQINHVSSLTCSSFNFTKFRLVANITSVAAGPVNIATPMQLTVVHVTQQVHTYFEHCQSSALKSPPLLAAADLPISEPVFLNTSTFPLSASRESIRRSDMIENTKTKNLSRICYTLPSS